MLRPRPSLRHPPKWLVGVIFAAVVIVVLVWIASLVLRPHLPTSAQRTAMVRRELALSPGGRAYMARCAYCHDSGIGPSLKGRGLTAEEVQGFVRNGVNGMPALPPVAVSDRDIAGIAAYVGTFPKAGTAGR